MSQLIKPIVPVLNWNNPLTKGLLIDVPFFETGGTKTKDLVSLTQGVTTNSPTFKKDIVGNVIEFVSASSQSISLGAAADFNLNRNFSIMSMVKQKTSQTAGKAIVSHTFGGYYLRMNAGKVDFLESQVTDVLIGNTTVSLNTWNMAGVTVDSGSTANVIVYLNGVADGTGTTTATFNGDTRSLKIGVDQNNSNTLTEFFDGQIAYVRIWNRVLNAQEVVELYENPFAIYHWPRYVPTGNLIFSQLTNPEQPYLEKVEVVGY